MHGNGGGSDCRQRDGWWRNRRADRKMVPPGPVSWRVKAGSQAFDGGYSPHKSQGWRFAMASLAPDVKHPTVVSNADWLAARKEFLVKEKEFTRLRDELSRQRRELPWERVEKQYVFESPSGKEAFADLFGKRSQLIVYHFMFGPGWKEGCPSCSFWADNFNGIIVHLNQRDATM